MWSWAAAAATLPTALAATAAAAAAALAEDAPLELLSELADELHGLPSFTKTGTATRRGELCNKGDVRNRSYFNRLIITKLVLLVCSDMAFSLACLLYL